MRIFFLFFSLICFPIFAGKPTGSLIVSFHTGAEGERLERIRFRLFNERQDYKLFPQGSCHSNEGGSPNRIVVVDDLVPGEYTIEFLVPNTDRLFEEVPKKIVAITAGESTRIDQYFHPRYASLKASAVTCMGVPPFVSWPSITLQNAACQPIAQSSSGELKLKNLIPGEYTLHFEELAGYKAPSSIRVDVKPGEDLGPFVGSYDCQADMRVPEMAEPISFPLFHEMAVAH